METERAQPDPEVDIDIGVDVDDELRSLVVALDPASTGATLLSTLRLALGDPALELVYLRSGSGNWMDEFGHPAPTAPAGEGRAVTPIERRGKPFAALVHDPVLLLEPERLRIAIRAISLAIDNAQLRAELRAELLDVQASRARIVEVADQERRRVERNLHDGAQQRLVGLALMLRLVSREVSGDPALTELLAEAAGELDRALADLRELARGLHPAIVTDAGLAGALETLAERPGAPVALFVDVPGRLPDAVEVGAYYVVAEALANAAKHARAGQVAVRAVVVDGVLHVAVSDDGCGGAAPAPGSGLEGLADRVSALGGRLVIDSRPGVGTTVTADLPLGMPGALDLQQRRRLTALKWIGWERWELPPEAYEQLLDEDNLTWAKALLAIAGGSEDAITEHERDWLVGYMTTAHTVDWVLEAIRTYDGGDPIETIMQAPSMMNTARGILYDSLRMCTADGALPPDKLEFILRAADRMGIGRDVVADLHEVVVEERALRRRRYELITAPVLPAR